MHAIDLRAWLFLLHAILSVAIACMVLGSPLVLPELMGRCHTPCAVEYDGASPWGTPVKASFPQLTYPSEVLQPHCHHPPSGPAPACVPSAPQLSMPSFAVPLCAVPLTPPAANARCRWKRRWSGGDSEVGRPSRDGGMSRTLLHTRPCG
jgi:hypothetical protein